MMKIESQAMKTFRSINNAYPSSSYVDNWKKQDKKVMGWLCSYVPEEIMYAADIFPVRLSGYHSQNSLTDATLQLSEGICTFARSCLQLINDKGMNYIDGFVGANCCDHTRRLTEFLDYHKTAAPFNIIINPPLKMDESAVKFYELELQNFRKELEDYIEHPISNEALWDAIELHNETRDLIRRLYLLRKKKPSPILGSDVIEILNASFIMPKPDFNKLMSKLLSELDEASGESSHDFPRLMLIGSPMTDNALVKDIEKLGGQVVVEEMCTTGRHYWNDVLVDRSLDPIEALAKRYLTNFPCARMVPVDIRMNTLVALAKEWNVQGVISANVRFCTPYIYDVPILRDVMEEEGYPLLELNMEYNEGGKGQFETKIQAFFEMLDTKGGYVHA